jgi:arylformamidase
MGAMVELSRLIDITLPFSERLPAWPGDAAVQILRSTGVATVSELRMSSHVGTHLDAPAHFFPQGRSVDQLPLETLIGPAWVVGFDTAATITADDLDGAGIPAGVERLLLRTRNSAVAPTPSTAFNEDFVGLDSTAGDWLLSRHIQLAGIDGPSVDPFASGDFPVHRLLLANQVIIVENLRLHGVKAGPYRLICLPLAYEGGDGAPVRAVLETISQD